MAWEETDDPGAGYRARELNLCRALRCRGGFGCGSCIPKHLSLGKASTLPCAGGSWDLGSLCVRRQNGFP
jgi:hypothetical protein